MMIACSIAITLLIPVDSDIYIQRNMLHLQITVEKKETYFLE